MIPSIAEIIARADKEPERNDKIRILREEFTKPLGEVLIAALDKRIKWLLPNGEVTYKPCSSPNQEGMLYQQTRSFYTFVAIDGQPQAPNLTQMKREVLFIQLLESLDPRDAVLMIAVKDGTLPYPSITGELVNEAFPNLLYLGEQPKQSFPASVVEAVKGTTETVTKKRGRGRPRKVNVQDQKSA